MLWPNCVFSVKIMFIIVRHVTVKLESKRLVVKVVIVNLRCGNHRQEILNSLIFHESSVPFVSHYSTCDAVQ